jgi:diguanylate cyclase
VSEQEFKRALGYATSALGLLKRSMIPPYPQFYELLYTYATGVNPTLNARINAIFREGSATPDLVERLYNEFLRAQDANERISNVSHRMSQRIDAVHEVIDTALSSAASYAVTLERARQDLEADIDPQALKLMASQLLAETRSIQVANQQLEQKLGASRDDIAQLQRDLDDARREAMLDPLTKIFNRKYLDEGLAKACERAEASGEALSLLLLDIDSFKLFNDTWGHQTGDQVLRLVAMTLKSNIKGRDLAGRYGGEEFAAILPETDLAGAVIVADNIRKAIQAKELLKRSTNEKLGRITASFGVAAFRRGETPAALLERTDRCLYAAKHAGRNKVISESDLERDATAAA